MIYIGTLVSIDLVQNLLKVIFKIARTKIFIFDGKNIFFDEKIEMFIRLLWSRLTCVNASGVAFCIS